jgi:hypothetical protein
MIYLLIIVGIGQLLQLIYCCKTMMYVKRKHRIINAHISNLTEWIILSNQSVMAQLNKMNEQLQNTPVNKEDKTEHVQELHKNTGKSPQPSETVLRPVNGYAG